MLMLFLLLFTTCSPSSSKEVDFGIYPSKISYLEQEEPCYMVCASGEIDIESIQWISITKNSKPMVSLLYGDELEWVSQYKGEADRIRVNGSLKNAEEAFLRLDFDYVKCEDEARYQCVIEGYGKNDVVQAYKASEEMVVYSTHGKPRIKIESHVAVNNEVTVIPDIELTLSCEGPAGKPAAPMYWLKYDPESRKYLKTDLDVGEDSLTLPLNDLCRYHRKQTLKYVTQESEQNVSLKCVLGYYEQEFIIHTLPTERRFPKGYWRQVGTEVNGCRKQDMVPIYLAMISVITTMIVFFKE